MPDRHGRAAARGRRPSANAAGSAASASRSALPAAASVRLQARSALRSPAVLVGGCTLVWIIAAGRITDLTDEPRSTGSSGWRARWRSTTRFRGASGRCGGCTPASSKPATWCSTSARTRAIARAVSRRSGAASSRSNRSRTSRACCGRCSADRRESRSSKPPLGAMAGKASLSISDRTPTVTTVATGWRDARSREADFGGVHWNRRIDVEMTTLDLLIARWGLPAFVKIDVEGAEPAVLAGLTQPVPACLVRVRARCAWPRCAPASIGWASSGRYLFNWSAGESFRLESGVLAERGRADGEPGHAARPAAIRRRLRPAERRARRR